MPCHEASQSDYLRAEAELEWMHNSPVAEMLCAVLRQVDKKRFDIRWSARLEEWWREHKARDAKR